MRDSSKAALGGMIAALSTVIMLITYLSPLFVYTAPPFAGILLIVILEELNVKWAAGTYVAIGLLSMFMIADKEAAVFFVFFFGYYPIVREYLRGKIESKRLLFFAGLVLFNVSCACAVLLCAFVFHIDYSSFYKDGKILIVLSVLLMNAVFVVYDILIARVHEYYKKRIKRRIKKIFK